MKETKLSYIVENLFNERDSAKTATLVSIDSKNQVVKYGVLEGFQRYFSHPILEINPGQEQKAAEFYKNLWKHLFPVAKFVFK